MSQTVFISSTCYDLIDLRAELEALLRDSGLVPIMSDRQSAEFEVLPNQSSIESCLSNVRSCDICIVVLSQRYGPTLGRYGYDDISATHLEYREARKHRKPIHMYVRDRLDADYTVSKRNRGVPVSLPWVKPGDEPIFSLLEEHRRLAARSKQSNWFWVFRDSAELKERVRKDLAVPMGSAVLERLVRDGRTAFALVEIPKWCVRTGSGELSFDLAVTNAGSMAAIGLDITCSTQEDEYTENCRALLPAGEAQLSYRLRFEPITCEVDGWTRFELPLRIECTYATPEGHLVGDETIVPLTWTEDGPQPETPICIYRGKRYLGSSGFDLVTRDGE